MKIFKKKNILLEIKNRNEEILVHLTERYFPSLRRFLRSRGLRDAETPEAFSKILASVFINLSTEGSSTDLDFEKYLLNAVDEYVTKRKSEDKKGRSESGKSNLEIPTSDFKPDHISAHCVSILDEHLQKLLYARVVERLSYEKIAERFEYSNAVIAQYEIDKAFQQLEGIVKLRLNVSLN